MKNRNARLAAKKAAKDKRRAKNKIANIRSVDLPDGFIIPTDGSSALVEVEGGLVSFVKGKSFFIPSENVDAFLKDTGLYSSFMKSKKLS